MWNTKETRHQFIVVHKRSVINIFPTLYLLSIHLCPIHTNYLQCSIFSNKVSLHTQCTALSYHSVYIIFLDRKAVGLNSWLNALRKHWLDTNNTWEKDVKLHPDIFEWKASIVFTTTKNIRRREKSIPKLKQYFLKIINWQIIFFAGNIYSKFH